MLCIKIVVDKFISIFYNFLIYNNTNDSVTHYFLAIVFLQASIFFYLVLCQYTKINMPVSIKRGLTMVFCCCRMTSEHRMSGSIDKPQLSSTPNVSCHCLYYVYASSHPVYKCVCSIVLVHSPTDQEVLLTWDGQIRNICHLVNSIVNKISASHADWITAAMDSQMSKLTH